MVVGFCVVVVVVVFPAAQHAMWRAAMHAARRLKSKVWQHPLQLTHDAAFALPVLFHNLFAEFLPSPCQGCCVVVVTSILHATEPRALKVCACASAQHVWRACYCSCPEDCRASTVA